MKLRPVDPGPPKPPPPPPGGGKSFDWAEFTPVAVSLFFMTILSLYNISNEGYLGLSEKTWGFIWAVGENGLAITMSLFIGVITVGLLKQFFRWVMIPYFTLRLLYHVSCYAGLYLWTEKRWADIWSAVLILFLLFSVIYCYVLIKRKHVD